MIYGEKFTRRFLPILLCTMVMLLAVPTTAVQAQSAIRSSAASLSPTLSVSSQLSLRRYVAAGDRAYDLGSEDGRYPAMGFHTRGEMGGIWSPSIKLLDGIWFGVNGQWIGPATSFTSGFGYVQMALPTIDGVQVTRTDFAPDGRRAVRVRAHAHNVALYRTPSQRRCPFRTHECISLGFHHAQSVAVQPPRHRNIQRSPVGLQGCWNTACFPCHIS